MTTQEIISNIERARACLRSGTHTKTDAEQDYWAHRLIFWNDMFKEHMDRTEHSIPLNK